MRFLAAALLVSFAACTGGGGGKRPTFTLQSVDPNESLDLNGGDKVIIRGTNFVAAGIQRVLFGDSPGFGFTVLSPEEIEVTAPPSPSGNAGPVNVEVETRNFGIKGIFAGYTYVGSGGGGGGPPDPQTIFPTNFTATGAESFTISGSNLGPGGGQIIVNFAGIGSVNATVSNDGKFATGNAPLAGGVPPAVPIQVAVDNQGQGAVVPTVVRFNYTAPSSFQVGFQEGGGNSSLPVKVGNGIAVVATSGLDANWGNVNGTGNDSLWLITGPPLASAAVDLFTAQPSAVRRLDKDNSVPVALDSDTVCLYSPGPDGINLTGDEVVIVVTNLQSVTPTVQTVAVAMLTPAPLARISSTRIAMTTRGTGSALQDELRFLTVNAGVPALDAARVEIGLTDGNAFAGRTFRSLPFTPDGDTVFVFSLGPAGGARVFGDANDLVTRYVVSTGAAASTPAPFLLDTPIALSANRLVAPAKFQANPPNADDNLAVYDFAGGSFSTRYFGTGARIQAGGLPILEPLGNGHVVIPHGGLNGLPGDADDQIAIFRADGAGGFTQLTLSLAGRPLFAPLGDGSLVVFGRGPDLAPGTGDDRALQIRADGSGFAEFQGPPVWMHGTITGNDATRVFALGAGLDHPFYGTGDEELLVFQTKSLGSMIATATLPLSPPIGYRVFASPSQGAQARTPFVPVGASWGLMQSPGLGNFFGLSTNRVIVVTY